MQSLIWAIVAFPLLTVAVSVLVMAATERSARAGAIANATVATIFSLASVFCAVTVLITLSGFEGIDPSAITGSLFTWAELKLLQVDVGLLADGLSMPIAIAISVIGFLTNLYALGYKNKDRSFSTFVVSANAVLFLALLSVLSENLLLCALGIVGVGIFASSGMFSRRTEYAAKFAPAGILFSGLGDVLLLAGIYLVFGVTQAAGVAVTDGIFTFDTLQKNAAYFMPVATPISLLFALGLAAKLGLLPLGIWMPTASGKKPHLDALVFGCALAAVSAYLLLRIEFILVLSPTAMKLIAWMGAVTAIYAATCAVFTKSISRATLFVAISQSAFLFISAGIGAFQACAYHVIVLMATCPLIFFCTGSASIELGGEDNMWAMGGLKKKMPITAWTYLMAAASAAAVFPFAGFFSRDALLRQAFERGEILVWVVGFISLGLVSFAMFRIAGLVFWGPSSSAPEKWKRVTESAVSMLIPCMLLATATATLGLINLPFAIGGSEKFAQWISAVVSDEISRLPKNPSLTSELILMASMVVWSAHFAILGAVIYAQKRQWAMSMKEKLGVVGRILENGFYIDAIPSLIWNSICFVLGKLNSLLRGTSILDVTSDGVSSGLEFIGRSSEFISRISLQLQLLIVAIGAIALVIIFAL